MSPMSFKKKEKEQLFHLVLIFASNATPLRGNQDLVRGDGGKRRTKREEEGKKTTGPHLRPPFSYLLSSCRWGHYPPSLPPFVPSVNTGSIKPCARSRVRHASKTTPNPAPTCPFIRRPLMHKALRVIVWLNSFFLFFSPRSLSFEPFRTPFN